MANPILSMSLWYCGLLSYAAFHLLHLVAWRLGNVQTGIRLLFAMLVGIPALIYLNLFLKFGSAWVVPGVIHLLLAANYIAVYPAFQASSPTIRILAFLRRRKGAVEESELIASFGTENVLGERMADLAESGLVRSSEGKLYLSKKADLLAGFFILYRRAIGLPQGGG